MLTVESCKVEKATSKAGNAYYRFVIKVNGKEFLVLPSFNDGRLLDILDTTTKGENGK